MKRQVICLMLLMVMCFTLTGCFENARKILSGGTLNGEYGSVEQNVKKKDSMVYKMGEQIEIKNDSLQEKDQYIYSLKKATIYQNPTIAGLKQNQLRGVDYYPPYSNESKWLDVKVEMGMQVILCDIWIKNIRQSEQTISDFFVVYETPEGDLKQLGDPIYFSHHQKEAGKYYHYKLAPGKTMKCQVAWSCDTNQLKNLKLYWCYSLYDEENRKLIPIDISVKKDKKERQISYSWSK